MLNGSVRIEESRAALEQIGEPGRQDEELLGEGWVREVGGRWDLGEGGREGGRRVVPRSRVQAG